MPNFGQAGAAEACETTISALARSFWLRIPQPPAPRFLLGRACTQNTPSRRKSSGGGRRKPVFFYAPEGERAAHSTVIAGAKRTKHPVLGLPLADVLHSRRRPRASWDPVWGRAAIERGSHLYWMPACAGMTAKKYDADRHLSAGRTRRRAKIRKIRTDRFSRERTYRSEE